MGSFVHKFFWLLNVIEHYCFPKKLKLENIQINMLSSISYWVLSVVDSDKLFDGDTAWYRLLGPLQENKLYSQNEDNC